MLNILCTFFLDSCNSQYHLFQIFYLKVPRELIPFCILKDSVKLMGELCKCLALVLFRTVETSRSKLQFNLTPEVISHDVGMNYVATVHCPLKYF